MSKLVIHSLYNPPPAVDEVNDEPSMTKQAFMAEADINTIMSRYDRTGSYYDPTVIPSSQPKFGDYVGADDYLAMQNALVEADLAFAALPAKLRKRFDNDPAELLAFLEDKANLPEAIELGLVDRPAEPVAPVETSTGAS
nr:MAG: internal scaffolding protein [Microvirus sp.]